MAWPMGHTAAAAVRPMLRLPCGPLVIPALIVLALALLLVTLASALFATAAVVPVAPPHLLCVAQSCLLDGTLHAEEVRKQRANFIS